ncbi:MAG TPA: YdeI/OmpD-associated family protein [Clostridia bacterium]|nr:YdeI/OmpD-associated family protein [Clostridia bacterium]
MLPYIEKALKENGVLEQYLKQPDYLKWEQVNYIEVAKKEETKQNRLNKLIAMLKEKV